MRHGANVKRCSHDGCTNFSMKEGVCWRHGAKDLIAVKKCSSEGCTNNVANNGVCVRHGAKLKFCSSEGCTNRAVKGGVCIKHGAKAARCIFDIDSSLAKSSMEPHNDSGHSHKLL